MALRMKNIAVRKAAAVLVEDVDFTVDPGRLVAIIGPNGAGKTSLLRAGIGLEDHRGSVSVDGADWASLSPTERARKISYLPQKRPLAWPLKVRDIVALGRFAYGAAPRSLAGTDARAVDAAIASCSLEPFADRAADTLSGGEEARLHCARAFAAETPYILADEPATSLDPYHQRQVMKLFKGYTERGGGAAVVLHDMGLAAHYADDLLVLKQGRVVAEGPTASTLTADLIEDVYGVKARVTDDGVTVLP
ncbi:ABC transporter ATP-binding protein [Parvularcula lutaonensis]|uniref:ABC transporter ATP-binding protein n=1 Tax=Parvularcula lutaonensis TaxID=491923 RepID=A0ABV7M7B4_9PROT|nr:ABC transporter ATP-binding protein [Parvularcula lutaonensis]GGY56252.1 ABC transporter [Parvularcula lutaonensis]